MNNKEVEVFGTIHTKVYVDPIKVIEEIHVIGRDNWIIERKGKYIEMSEESAGQHSFDDEVGEVTQEVYDLYKAKELLINYLKSK